MHTLYLFSLFTLFTLLVPLSLSQITFYIDETSNSSHPDGSRSNPFPTFDEATTQLYPGTFDIILLGESITINNRISFPPGSICTIRPQTVPESGHYPFQISIDASMEIQQTNVTFQDIQFIELYPYRDPNIYAIIISNGFLFLNRVLLSDIQYQSQDSPDPSPYPFISAWGLPMGEAALLLVDCQFKNLSNVRIWTFLPHVMMQNTSFENIQMDYDAFLVLDFWDHPNTSFTMLNTSLMNSRFESSDQENSGGLVSLSGSYVEFSIEGFSAKNISIKNRATLIEVRDYPIEDNQEYPARLNIRDIVLEDIVEIEYDDTTREIGLIFDVSGPRELTLRNLTARNVKFESGSLLKYFPHVSNLLPYEAPGSEILLQDIKIDNSLNTSFVISFTDSGQVKNVELVNVESKEFPAFSFLSCGTVAFKDIYGRNISGPVISLDQVFSQNLQNLTFYNVSMFPKSSLVLLTRSFDITHLELIANFDQSTVITNFFIDGSEYIEAEEGESYVMTIGAEIGTVLIRDSIWKNINTGSLFVSNQTALKMDNFTVNGVSVQAADILNPESFENISIVENNEKSEENHSL